MASALEVMADAAEKNHLAEIEYRKPGERQPGARIVEPYGLQTVRGHLLVRCWQVDPDPLGDAWRSFRASRIVRAREVDKKFKPRDSVHFPRERLNAPTPEAETGAGRESSSHRYHSYLEAAMLDGKITKHEMHEARQLGEPLDRDHLRAAHAKVFRDVLDEMLLDGRLDDEEEHYLQQVATFLHRLGWVPAAVEK